MGKCLGALYIEVSKSLDNRDIERRVPTHASYPRLHHDLIVDCVDVAGCMGTSKNLLVALLSLITLAPTPTIPSFVGIAIGLV
jgi:hypothetical protein